MVRWAHKTLRDTSLVIGSTRHLIDCCGIITTESGDDPSQEHIRVLRAAPCFHQVKVDPPAPKKPAPAPPLELEAPAAKAEEEEQAPPKEEPKPKPKPKRGRRSAKKK